MPQTPASASTLHQHRFQEINLSFRTRVYVLLALLALFIIGLHQAPTAHATTSYVVTKTADTTDGTCDSDCSLSEAITAANTNVGADTLTFNIPGTDGGCTAANICTITLSNTLPAIGDDLTIDGSANAGHITVDGVSTYRVMVVNNSKTVNLNALTIVNGFCNQCPGGGISNSGTLNVTNSTFSGNSGSNINSGGGGGGMVNFGTLNVSNSTFSGNSATLNGFGGAIYNFIGTATIRNSTFSGNSANGSGGAIYNLATLTLYNTIVANSSSGGDCAAPSGTLTADAYNLDSDGSCGNATTKTSVQLALGALADNGGATQTLAIGTNSAAFEAGNNSVCAAAPVSGKDQRGTTRPQGPGCDVGAYEYVIPVASLAKPILTSPVKGSVVSKAKVILDWGDVNSAALYEATVYQDNKQGSLVVDKTVGLSTVKTPKLAKGHHFYWRVRACDLAGCGPWSKWFNFSIP